MWSAALGKHCDVQIAVDDIDDDNLPEIVTCTQDNIGESYDPLVIAYDNNGLTLWTYTITGRSAANPDYASLGITITDLYDDGYKQVIYGTEGDFVDILNATDGTLLYQYENTPNNPSLNTNNFETNPIISDIDRDGEYEIILGDNNDTVTIFDNTLSIEARWTSNPFAEGGDEDFEGYMAIADIDFNGRLDIVVPDSDDASIYVLEVTKDGGTPDWPHAQSRYAINTTEMSHVERATNPPFTNISVGDTVCWVQWASDDADQFNGSMDNQCFDITSTAPVTALESPADLETYTGYSVDFNCSATASESVLTSIALWGNWTGTWHENDTYSASGTYDTNTWTVSLPDPDTEATALWNCLTTDNIGQTDWGNSNRTLNLIPYEFSVNYDSPVFEALVTPIYLNISMYSSLISSIEASLFYDGVNESYDSKDSNNFTALVVPDLVTLNASNHTFNWVYEITYTNGSSQEYNTTDTNQTIMHAYAVGTAIKNAAHLIELEDLNVTHTITRNGNAATLSMTLYYNDTAYTMTNISDTFSYLLNTTEVSADVNNYTVSFNTSLNVTYNDVTRILNTSTDSITVYKMILTNCTAPSTTETLQFFFRDEDTDALLVSDFDTTFNVWETGELARNYSWELTGANNYSICLYPAWASYTTDMMSQYESSGYSPRNYYLDEAAISNVSQTINLYLGDNTTSDLITFQVLSAVGYAVEDVYITISEYNIGTGTYNVVAILNTNFDGKAFSYLTKNTKWYRFILTLDGEVVGSYGPTILTEDDVTFKLSADYGQWFDYYDQYAYNCSLAGNTTTCTITDTSGLMVSARLLVRQWAALNWTTLCDTTNTGSTVTLLCALGSTANNIYHYQFIGTFDGADYVIESGYYDYRAGSTTYGTMGVLLALMLMLVMVGIGIIRPPIAMLLGVISLMISYGIGLLAVSWGAIIGLLVVAAVIMIKTKGGGSA
jgi:hypothetical protein